MSNKVIINGKEASEDLKIKTLNILEEHDKIQEEIEALKITLTKLERKAVICEARLIEHITDIEIDEAGGSIPIEIYSIKGQLIGERTLQLQVKESPKKIGVNQIKNLLSDLIQQDMMVVDADALFTWFEENGYNTPFERTDTIDKITSLELLELLTKSVEKTGQTRRIRRNALK